MDKNKLEVSGKDANNTPASLATYKPIPESEYLEGKNVVLHHALLGMKSVFLKGNLFQNKL